MKKILFLSLLVLTFTNRLSAQLDSLKYVLNRTGPTQAANFNVAGFGAFVHDGSNNFSGTLLLQNATAPNGGVNMQLTGDATPGFATWMRDATGFKERMRLLWNGNLGLGTTVPSARLHVNGDSLVFFKVTQSNIAATDAYLHIRNATSNLAYYIPNIIGRTSMPGRAYGLYITGEAEDVLPVSDNSIAAVILDGRTKTATRLQTNNVLAINSAGANLIMVKADGSLGIGTSDTKGYKLAVNGSGVFTKVVVKAYNNWPDFVFKPDYQLPSLTAVAQYVTKHEHLPGIPSAGEVEKEGIDVGEMNKKLLQKIEEHMLYMIEMNNQIMTLKKEVQELKEKTVTK
ncbi:hypothetical protein [Chitinophaga sp. RAB17]|uniref:hypothetical protein n=1 Tax=Chitinophaga sp. RAB17 TaxID=3233049 RepID=UPI003F8E1FEE